MKVTYKDDGEYILKSDDDAFLGSLKFEGWSYSKATMMTQYGDFYTIASKGFWGTSIGISKGDFDYADLKMNWKGQIVINVLNTEDDVDYLLATTSIWKSQFSLKNRNDQEVIILTPDYKWSKWHYDFKIDINPEFKQTVDETLVLLSVYSVLYLKMIGAASGAAS